MSAIRVNLLHTWWLLTIGTLLLSPLAISHPQLVSVGDVSLFGWSMHLLAQKSLTSWRTYVACATFVTLVTLCLFLSFSLWFWQDLSV
jgi:hypothetical protein